MTTEQALQRTRDIIRLKHLALSTEEVYCAWVRRYCDFVKKIPPHTPSEQKLEVFLTALAKDNVSASTQNQAFNAIIFWDRGSWMNKCIFGDRAATWFALQNHSGRRSVAARRFSALILL